MIDSLTIFFLSGKFIIGILFFIRISGVFVAGPFFRSQAIIPQMKVIIAVMLAASLTSVFWESQPQIDLHLWNLIYLVFKEFFVGVGIGFAANIVFWAGRFAGGLIDFDMGYQTGLLFNSDESSPTLVGEFFEMVTLMIFLLINGHHYLIESIWLSVKAVPINGFVVTQPSITMFIKLATTVLVIGIKMAAPVLTALFMTNLALSFLARVAPQTNVFVLSLQLKIGVGLIMLLITTPLFVMIAKYSLQQMETELLRLIQTFNGV